MNTTITHSFPADRNPSVPDGHNKQCAVRRGGRIESHTVRCEIGKQSPQPCGRAAAPYTAVIAARSRYSGVRDVKGCEPSDTAADHSGTRIFGNAKLPLVTFYGPERTASVIKMGLGYFLYVQNPFVLQSLERCRRV
ncbi:hypothetical protein J6590_016669 [Homalodisca vitripennis]|nr:hypothetical protein J6590_016669 [Homalodisca vitripennis]